MNSKLYIFIYVMLTISIAAASQFNFTLENDCFIPDKSLGRGDYDYTHGTGVEYVTDDLTHFKLGQNMYAPSVERKRI